MNILYSDKTSPLKTNSKKVPRFSGVGLVTKMLLRPMWMAAAVARPKAADFPRPLLAVTATVPCTLFSVMRSIIFSSA